MDTDHKSPNSFITKPLTEPLDLKKEEEDDHEEEEEDEDGERTSLLSPRRGGISKKRSKKRERRKVQWNDKNGDKLAEVKEFQPSDASDTDDEDLDSCICSIM